MENNLKIRVDMEGYQKTGDYGFVAYLSLMKNIQYLPDLSKKVGRGRMIYFFDIDQKTWMNYRMEFNNSEYARFLYTIKCLKDPSY